MSYTPNGLARVLVDVVNERNAQNAKWGHDEGHGHAIFNLILTEEVGEAAEAALGVLFHGHTTDHLREELVQIASVAVKWIEAIDISEERTQWEDALQRALSQGSK